MGDDIATATRSAYDQGVEANKAQNQRLLDALQAPELTHREGPPPKRCGPSMLTLPAVLVPMPSNPESPCRQRAPRSSAQVLGTLDLEGGMIQKPARETRKRSEPMRRGALWACLVHISTACICQKTLDGTTTPEPARRSGRRKTRSVAMATSPRRRSRDWIGTGLEIWRWRSRMSAKPCSTACCG